MAQEPVPNSPSDTGTAVSALHKEFGDKVNLSCVRDEWTDKSAGSVFQPLLDKLIARGREARRALRELVKLDGDGQVVVVLHGAFMHFLTNDWRGLLKHWKSIKTTRSPLPQKAPDGPDDHPSPDGLTRWHYPMGINDLEPSLDFH
ncbi:hypothetical protein V501_03414 [Pseudogymnoascus sp. VKM F-4519 (FW-2642)]|nr:hypothetical protein V501_03414 [Pseudogymnoascus sp. VKM F-4519 (FW-2642)]